MNNTVTGPVTTYLWLISYCYITTGINNHSKLHNSLLKKNIHIRTNRYKYTVRADTYTKLFEKLCKQNNHPLREICPKIKESTKLRTQEAQWSNISTERFKNSFINKRIFRHNLALQF